MNPNFDNIKTTFLRWLKGDATLKEENRLFAAAQEDDFLAEAIQGYEANPEADYLRSITRLKANMRSKSSAKTDNVLVRVAAIGLLVMVALYGISFLTNQTVSETTISQTLPTMKEDIKATENEDDSEEQHLKTQKVQQQSTDNTTQEAVPSTPRSTDDAQKATKRTTKPGASSISPEPMPESYAAEDLRIESVSPEVENRFRSGEMPKVTRPEVTTNPADANLNLKKKQDQFDAALNNSLSRFERYLFQNRKYPTTAAAANISADVVLRFEVNKEGRPTGIKIVSPIGYGCDEEAVRLLKGSPKWEVRTDTVLQVAIPCRDF